MGKDIQEDKGMLQEVDRKLRLLIGAFTGILYEDDDIFMEKMRRKKNLPEEELQKYAHWEWTQGVGLYGIWKLFAASGEKEYLEIVSEHGVRPELTRGADSLQIRRGLLDTCAAQGGRVIEDTVQLSGVVLQAEEHIAEHDPVSQLHES